MKRMSQWLGVVLLIGVLLSLSNGCSRPRDLTGTWQLDRSKSSDTDPWRKIALRIERDGAKLTLQKHWSAGRYAQERTLSFTTDGGTTEAVLPAPKWPETPHLGVWVKPGTVDKIVAKWEQEGKSLTTEERYPLQTSQGQISLTVRRTYELSDDGKVLTVTEKRSTRPNTLTFVYVRK